MTTIGQSMFTSIYSGNVDGNGDGDGTTKSTKDNPMTTNVWTDAKKILLIHQENKYMVII